MFARRVLLLNRTTKTAHRACLHTTPVWWGKVVHKFKLADIGEGITECEVIKWNIGPKSTVQIFDPLCEVQSDKASVEITSPFDGVVKDILVAEGQVAKVGEGLCLIEVEEEATSAAADVSEQAESAEKGSTPTARQAQAERRLHPLDPNHVSSPSQPELSRLAADIFAAPSVRHFAKKSGVDLSLIAPGSGKDGRIEKKDVEAYLTHLTLKDVPPQVQINDVKEQTGDVIVELGRTRYGMWKAMTKSLEIPTFGYTTSLDLTSLHNLLPILNLSIPAHFLPPPSSQLTAPFKPPIVDPSAFYPTPSPPQIPESGRYTKLSYLPFLLKTLSKAMTEWPIFRSSVTPSITEGKPTLTLRPHADISLALSTPTGLYTPTLTSVDHSSIYTLASRVAHLAYLGRQVPCGLTVKDMPKRGGTISVSNVGAVGRGESAVPVLVEGGGVAIVALGRAKWIWDVDEEVRHYYLGGNVGKGKRGRGEERLKLSVSWSADHRVVEGAELAAFVESWRAWVEVPSRLIGEGI
ncbi:hypothetical protein M378DRAFT_26658 [Amanita muscaria Koide BX008]|uniref:Dihydrolipoamide acetyltransferase component of pyruvate dehydrogenase complex n=1 Tax=Amanita muscaria (strain Koide BX008) TaxID=946122 RepID=A0A0C2WFI9_AMAMK|nr:hypothetical protein M378DRAFT_26658 [Amanita muscaria Koide BX008]